MRQTRLLPLRRFAWILLGLLACAEVLLFPPRAAAETPLEYQVKAAFLLNFAKFVEWPATAFTDADSPVSICILGNDPFGHTLDDLVQGEAVNGRKLVVRRSSEPAAPQSCQVAFIGGSSKDIPKTLTSLGRGVLTVGEGESFSRAGGIIAFVIDNRRVRFDINQSVAENAGLKLSSKLLSVARAVLK
jgi:hypothetical protein